MCIGSEERTKLEEELKKINDKADKADAKEIKANETR